MSESRDSENTLNVYFDQFAATPLSPLGTSFLAHTLLANVADRFVESAGPRQEYSMPLVQSYSLLADGRTYRFHLVENRTFHNGSEITSQDMIASLQYYLSHSKFPGSLSNMLSSLKKDRNGNLECLKRVSKFKLEIELNAQQLDFIDALATSRVVVFSAAAAKLGRFVYSGLYQISQTTNTEICLEIFPGHPEFLERLFAKIVLTRLLARDDFSELLNAPRTALVCEHPQSLQAMSKSTAAHYAFSQPSGRSILLGVPKNNLALFTNARALFQNFFAEYSLAHSLPFAELLHSVYPQNHALHVPVEQPSGTGATAPISLHILHFISPESSDFFETIHSEINHRKNTPQFSLGMTAGVEQQKLLDLQPEFNALLFDVTTDFQEFLGAAELQIAPIIRQCSKNAPELLANLKQAKTQMRERGLRMQALRTFYRNVLLKSQILPLFFIPRKVVISDDLRQSRRSPGDSFPKFGLLRKIKTEVDEESIRRTKIEAITATTQMFAHDVRKPFSLLRMTMDMITRSQSLNEIKVVADRMIPEIDKAMNSVNGMIQDLMEVGSQSDLNLETICPSTFLSGILFDIFRYQSSTDVEFEYQLEHVYCIEADPHKLSRLFSNILTNAIQAMNMKGRIWICSRELDEDGKQMTLFSVGNSNSFIPEKDQKKIFEAFYTKGKRNGTGLGLAIAHKIVISHGGRIWCASQAAQNSGANAGQESRTEFFWTLPTANNVKHHFNGALPNHSREFETAALSHRYFESPQLLRGTEEQAEKLERKIILEATRRNAKIRLLVVDDEQVYREALKLDIERSPALARAVSVFFAENSESALDLARVLKPDVCICDIDLGKNSTDGFALVRQLRDNGLKSEICIHSNQTSTEHTRRALESGANFFLPKPMSRVHLVKLIADALTSDVLLDSTEDNKHPDLQSVVVVDDNVVVLHAWSQALKGLKVHLFSHPRQFWESLESGAVIAADLSCVVADFYFDGEDSAFGYDFAQKLKQTLKCPVLLCTNAELGSHEVAKVADAFLEKRALNAKELSEFLATIPLRNLK